MIFYRVFYSFLYYLQEIYLSRVYLFSSFSGMLFFLVHVCLLFQLIYYVFFQMLYLHQDLLFLSPNLCFLYHFLFCLGFLIQFSVTYFCCSLTALIKVTDIQNTRKMVTNVSNYHSRINAVLKPVAYKNIIN